MDILPEITKILVKVRKEKPLIHHLTNFVTANDSANITLAIGASPVMANDPLEAEEMALKASTLVINLGTLNHRFFDGILAAGLAAKHRGIPVILDPVGAGGTSARTRAARQLVETVKPDVIRGNLAEIQALAGQSGGIKGVDSAACEVGSDKVAVTVAKDLGCVVALTGRTDIITDGRRMCRIDNGSPLLTSITGAGCMATSLTGSCCAVAESYFSGTVAGIAVMGVAGELAGSSLAPGEGVGTFRMRLFDAVYTLAPELITQYGKITCEECFAWI